MGNTLVYRQFMAPGFYVRVPADVANCLADDGFRVAGPTRGVDTVLADSANLVTVLVGSHEIARFVAHLWNAVRRRKPASPSQSKMIIEHDGRRVAITLEHEGFGAEGPPQTVVAGMSALLTALAKPGWKEP